MDSQISPKNDLFQDPHIAHTSRNHTDYTQIGRLGNYRHITHKSQDMPQTTRIAETSNMAQNVQIEQHTATTEKGPKQGDFRQLPHLNAIVTL